MFKKWFPRAAVVLAVVGLIAALAVGVVAAQGQGPGGGPHHGGEAGFGLIEAVADATGLDPADVLAQVRDGATLNDIATENGADPNDIIDEVLANIETKLGEAVADGRISQEQADEVLANAADMLPQVMDGTVQPQGGFGGHGPQDGEFGGGPRHGKHGVDVMQALIGLVADATGLTPMDVVEQLRDGATLNDIATENGADPDDIIADALDAAEARLDEAVANGNLTQEQADEMLANAADTLPQIMDGTFQPQGPQGPQGGGRCAPHGHALVGLVAEATGLNMSDIVSELEAGKTLAQIATENSADPDDIIADALAVLQEHLDEAVANGSITQQQADDMLAKAAENLEQMMNKTFDFQAPGPVDSNTSL